MTIRNAAVATLVVVGAVFGHDGVHPTDAGHAYMAAKIAPWIYGQLTTGT